jgi:hypothetical protein
MYIINLQNYENVSNRVKYFFTRVKFFLFISHTNFTYAQLCEKIFTY